MTIAIDKNIIDKITFNKNNEYIYLFEDEKLEDLIKTNLHCINTKYCDFVDINLTDYDVDCFKKAKITDKDYDKMPDIINYKIGIIIPNCNYGDCLEKCLTSILNQTYQNFEIIFVDDCSTDNSVKIAEETYYKYMCNRRRILPDVMFIGDLDEKMKIVQLKQKRYNGGARNEGYLHLSDDVDYVWYVDSDDWLYDNQVLENINKYLQSKPDVLFVGMVKYMNNELSIACTPNYKDRYDAIQGWSGSCGKVIKKSLATRQECLYNEGTLKEDKNQHCRICIYMKNFEVYKKPVYVWNRQNTKSVTTVREKIMWGTSTIRHYADTKQLLLSIKGQDKRIDEFLQQRLDLCLNEIKQGGDAQY